MLQSQKKGAVPTKVNAAKLENFMAGSILSFLLSFCVVVAAVVVVVVYCSRSLFSKIFSLSNAVQDRGRL